MRVTLAIFACHLLASASAHAEVLNCKVEGPQPGMQTFFQFEVWPQALPAPDYLDALEACLARPGTAPAPEPPRSQWLENQRSVYTDALRKQRVDVIVAPFQIQGYGLERTERALMSADLAYHLDPAMRVADPFLTARALGEGARRYETGDIVALARAVGAHTAVVGYVGHDREHRMTVTVQVLKIGDGGAVETVQRDWRSVSFAHFDPPFAVFHRLLPSVLESLALPVVQQPHERAPVVFSNGIAFPFADLATDETLGASLGLSLLGAMTASVDERSRERLFERALVTSWHFDAPGAETAFLRAYALLNLGYRPAALALINGSTAPESVALRALLNGDLPGAAAAVSTVENPLKRLLLAVQVDDLRYAYEREDMEQATDAASVFADDAADWLLLAEGRSNDRNIWKVDDSAALKVLLDETYPVAGLGIQSVFGGSVAVGAPVDDVAVDIATMRHITRFVGGAEVPVCCSADSARPGAWDLAWLLEGRTEAHMSRSLYLTSVIRGVAESAIDAIERYRSVFEGHPLFATSRAAHAAEMGKQADGDTLQRWQREEREHALAAAVWSPGQSQITYRGLRTHDLPSSEAAKYVDAYGFDYPRRPWWPAYGLLTTRASGSSGRDSSQQHKELLQESLPYARTETYPFSSVMPQLLDNEKALLLLELGPRFIGHPQRGSLMATLRPPRTPSGDPLADAKAAVDEDPENWTTRYSASRKLVEEHGKWADAAELLLAYPSFHRSSSSDPVRVSNYAYEAGSIFYWGGHEDLAIPFYTIAANLQTGAASQMTSDVRLNILEGRYRLATAGSYARAQRYPDAYPFRDLLSFMHALGYSEEAWNGFSQVATSFDNPQIWVSALVGQRKQGLTEPEIRAWLKQPGIRDARFRNNLFAPRYAVLVNASDHMPPEDLGVLVAELEGEPTTRVVAPGYVERPNPDGTSNPQRIRRSIYADSMPIPPDGTRVKTELAFFGAAYAAIRHGRFDEAVAEFTAMATYYGIEGREYRFALPYFAWAAAKAGDATRLEDFVTNTLRIPDASFDINLARAFFHGVRKETTRARELLDAALRAHPFTDHRPVLVEYQWAEACEWLYKETGDDAFVDMLLAWVVSQQKVQPTHAWPYAMEYTYARDSERKRRALAMTLYLDPLSPRIREASAKERAEAEAWGATNNLFLLQDEPPETNGPVAHVHVPAAHAG